MGTTRHILVSLESCGPQKSLAPGLERPHTLQSVASGGTHSDVLGKETSFAAQQYVVYAEYMMCMFVNQQCQRINSCTVRDRKVLSQKMTIMASEAGPQGACGRGVRYQYATNSRLIKKCLRDIA